MTARLAGIRVYPVKGMSGIPLLSARLDAFGVEHDRSWMVTDPDGTFLTQREHPSLTLVQGIFDADHLTLRAPGLAALPLPLAHPPGRPIPVRVWKDTLPAVPCGAEADRWFGALLGRPCRLVRLPPRPHRRVEGAPVAFSDGYPLHLLSLASIDELNRRLDTPVGPERFRPNLLVEGVEPHAEDGWRTIRVGAAELEVLAPCERCAVTTIDPADGTRGREPLRTLAAYRRSPDGGVVFGVYAVHRGAATLRVGDPVVSV